MTLAHLQTCRTLLEALDKVPPQRRFVTMWRPDREAGDETLSFAEFDHLSRKFAGLFRKARLEPGDRVLLIQPQGVWLMAAFVGAMMAGAVPSILAYPNFKVDPEKYRDGLSGVTRNLSAKLTVIDEAFPEALRSLISTRQTLQVSPGVLESAPATDSIFRPSEDDLAFLQHSAGTTGLQKGVALTHRQVLCQIRKLSRALGLDDRDRIATWLPLYHDMGLIACFILPLAAGLHVVMQSPVDWVLQPGSFLDLIGRHGCTLAWLPNFAFQFLARKVPDERRKGLDLSSMRAFVNCSEPVRAAAFDEFGDAYLSHGLRETALQSSYALAENVFAATQSPLGGVPRRIHVHRGRLRAEGVVEAVDAAEPGAVELVSCGPCLPGVRITVADPAGEPLPEGRVGELTLESDCLFGGYFNRPDLTAKALDKGRHRTGDRGFVRDGEVYVLGRLDDTIIIAGKNIDPQDVEEIAHAHPAISDGRAVAFGLENPDLGTRDLIVLAEARSQRAMAERERIALEIRRSVVAAIDVAPRTVRVVPPRWLVKSTAGKPARSTNREKFLSEFPTGTKPAAD